MERPNIIMILTDDQGAWAMGCAGNRDVKTPNLDRLAEEGVRFENFSAPLRSALRRGERSSREGCPLPMAFWTGSAGGMWTGSG